MPFDVSGSSITGQPTCGRAGRDLVVAWTSPLPAGSLFQIYLNRKLAWWGTSRRVVFPFPRDKVRVDVGGVTAGEGAIDYSASLAALPLERVTLTWTGGTFLAADIAGFYVYSSTAPGGAVSYTAPVANIPLTVAGVDLSGWGIGGWNEGGWGQSSANYSWTSRRLASGVWTFAVAPYDAAGNRAGSPLTTTATIAGPPKAPAPDSSGLRLHYSYNAGTRVPTLTWLASPP